LTNKYFIAGGAGFIGSHLVRRLLKEESNCSVVIYDNFSSGKMWHLDEVIGDDRLKVIQSDIKDIEALKRAMEGSEIVYHFASNPDIAKAMTQPDVDFWEGTYLTNNVIEAMRTSGVRKILYASGSGVYGDAKDAVTNEDYSPQLPISTYGASKLACEVLLCSYCHMFDFKAAAFRFANVVGPNQTHGVGYDFVRKLRDDNTTLKILGDGTQSKSYIYVTDVLDAMRLIEKNHLEGYSYFNVSTLDHVTVTEIADIVKGLMGLDRVAYEYTGGDRGWKGDVPVVRIDSSKIRKLGWTNKYTSAEAIANSVKSIIEDAKAGRFGWEGDRR
jgi:UDP-glucose 4-epimerase